MRKLIAPTYVDFDVTMKCNLKCSFCSAGATFSSDRHENFNEELSIEEIDKIFEEFDRLGIFRVSIGGGEPFLRKDILDIITLTEKYSFSTIVNTNATLIDDGIAKILASKDIDQIAVSLDSFDEQIHNKMRGIDNAQKKALSGIKALQKHGIDVTALITLTSYNIDTVIQTLEFLKNKDITNVTIMLLCPAGKASKNYNKVMYSYPKWKQLLLELTYLKENNKLPVNLTIVPANEGNIPWEFYLPLKEENIENKLGLWISNREIIDKNFFSCLAGINAAALTANGDVYGCDLMVAEPALCAGNVRENTFSEIWENSPIFKKLRNLKISENNGICKDCEVEGCGGGCRMSAFSLTGDLYGDDSRCILVEENKGRLN